MMGVHFPTLSTFTLLYDAHMYKESQVHRYMWIIYIHCTRSRTVELVTVCVCKEMYNQLIQIYMYIKKGYNESIKRKLYHIFMLDIGSIIYFPWQVVTECMEQCIRDVFVSFGEIKLLVYVRPLEFPHTTHRDISTLSHS